MIAYIKTTLMRIVLVFALFFAPANSAWATDPPYQQQMQQLLSAIGSLYFLHPLCGDEQTNWRAQAAELIALDNPDDHRRQRLNGAFNQGYISYARLHKNCSEAAHQATTQLLVEADRLTREIHSRYAEQN